MADYEAGLSTHGLATKFHINPETVGLHLKRNGVKTRLSVRAIPPADVPHVQDLRAQGLSYAKIGKQYGCSGVTVRNTLLQANSSE